jgi:hypothetical protein
VKRQLNTRRYGVSVVAFANMLNAREESSEEEIDASKQRPTGTRDYILILAGLVVLLT